MKKRGKAIVSLLLILTMTLSTVVSAHAQTSSFAQNSNNGDEIIKSDEQNSYIATEILGTTSDSGLNDLFENSNLVSSNRLISKSQTRLQNVSITKLNDNTIRFSSELLLNDTINEIVSEGKVYTADQGILQNTVFLIDMEDTKEYHFLQIKIDIRDENSPYISIILQNILTEELMLFETALESEFVADVANFAETLEREGFSQLYDVGKNLINPPEQTLTVIGTGKGNDFKVETFV